MLFYKEEGQLHFTVSVSFKFYNIKKIDIFACCEQKPELLRHIVAEYNSYSLMCHKHCF